MKKKEMLVIAVLLIVSFVALMGIKWVQSRDTSDKEVLIKQNGVIIKRIPLNEGTDTTFKYEKGDEFNVIVVKDGKASIEEASCRDQICVNHPPIENNGEIIVCLPHQLVVEIHSESESVEIDSVVE